MYSELGQIRQECRSFYWWSNSREKGVDSLANPSTSAEYRSDWFNVLLDERELKSFNTAYNNLLKELNGRPDEFRALTYLANQVYVNNAKELVEKQRKVKSLAEANRAHWSKEYSWYPHAFTPDSMIKYSEVYTFNNFEYQNRLFDYSEALSEYVSIVKRQERDAHTLQILIHSVQSDTRDIRPWMSKHGYKAHPAMPCDTPDELDYYKSTYKDGYCFVYNTTDQPAQRYWVEPHKESKAGVIPPNDFRFYEVGFGATHRFQYGENCEVYYVKEEPMIYIILGESAEVETKD